jgi:hypothetical protein
VVLQVTNKNMLLETNTGYLRDSWGRGRGQGVVIEVHFLGKTKR